MFLFGRLGLIFTFAFSSCLVRGFHLFALLALWSLISWVFVCGVVNNTFVVGEIGVKWMQFETRHEASLVDPTPDVCTLPQIILKDLRVDFTQMS